MTAFGATELIVMGIILGGPVILLLAVLAVLKLKKGKKDDPGMYIKQKL
ncbi:hypothetical protein IQ255_30015 [Pleurocapsales cyanobacterium LEGE 10410]|nr:hypothetical protein [Pleurocapsales cyanobacterium LEGE 10410]